MSHNSNSTYRPLGGEGIGGKSFDEMKQFLGGNVSIAGDVQSVSAPALTPSPSVAPDTQASQNAARIAQQSQSAGRGI